MRVEARRNLQLPEFDRIRGGGPERFTDSALFDEPADERPFTAVDPRLDARVVADGDEAGLNGAERTVRKLSDEDVAVVDVHAHHATRRADHPVGDEVAHG